MAVIGYPLNTQSHNDSGRHLIGQNHTASERSRMSIGCTRYWLNKSSTYTRLAYKPPDYGRTTRPPAHTHTRTRSGHELAPRHEAGHCLFFRLGALFFRTSFSGPLFPEPFFVDLEVAVRPFLMQSDTASRKRPFSTGLFFDWILLVLLLIRADFLFLSSVEPIL